MFSNTKGYKLFIGVSSVIVGLFVFFPLFWLVNTALKPTTETFNLTLFINHFSFSNMLTVLQDKELIRYMGNSMIVSFSSAFIGTLVAMFAGFSFSKFKYTGRTTFMTLVMMAQAFPQAILLLTLYMMMKKLRLDGSYMALVISYSAFILPVGTWTLKAYFDQLPDALIESAKIDGAGWMTIIFKIIFPLSIPSVVSTAIYGFVWSWNDLLYSMTLITAESKRTLAPGLVMKYMGEFTNSWSEMMAASIMVSIPVTIIFIFLQKYFIAGLTSGAVKG